MPKPNSRRRRGARHIGADPEFARTLARQEFGRIYWNDALEAELRKRLRFSQQRQVPAAVPKEPPRATAPARVPAKPETPRSPQWTPPRLREQRQKLAEARARLLEGRKTEHGGEEA